MPGERSAVQPPVRGHRARLGLHRGRSAVHGHRVHVERRPVRPPRARRTVPPRRGAGHRREDVRGARRGPRRRDPPPRHQAPEHPRVRLRRACAGRLRHLGHHRRARRHHGHVVTHPAAHRTGDPRGTPDDGGERHLFARFDPVHAVGRPGPLPARRGGRTAPPHAPGGHRPRARHRPGRRARGGDRRAALGDGQGPRRPLRQCRGVRRGPPAAPGPPHAAGDPAHPAGGPHDRHRRRRRGAPTHAAGHPTGPRTGADRRCRHPARRRGRNGTVGAAPGQRVADRHRRA